MNLKLIQIIGCSVAITACANLHRYEKPDAALVERMCGLRPSVALDGRQYIREAGITAVDGNLPGTGVDCKANPTYRIDPGAKQLTFFVFYQEPGMSYGYSAYPKLNVSLKPQTKYHLETTFDGAKVRLRMRETDSQRDVAQAESTDVKRHSTHNAALSVLPLLIK